MGAADIAFAGKEHDDSRRVDVLFQVVNALEIVDLPDYDHATRIPAYSILRGLSGTRHIEKHLHVGQQ